jgi:glycosyltransferase involved in cell wall biosynthesis
LQISPIKRSIKYFILKHFFKYIDYFLYIGILNKNFFLEHGVPSKKLFISPYCVDNEYFKKKKINKNKLKKKLNLNYKIIILYVGKFIERKKPLDYLELAKRFIHNKQVHFVMIGNGDLMHDCKKFIKKNFLDNVSIIGFKNQNELKNYYHISDLLIITSKYETWGLVINEAMASGLPVIATKQCGATEDLIKNAKTGYLYNHYELDKLFSNFNKFLNKIDLKKKIKKNIQLKINNYNYEQTISSLKKILNDK